LVQEGRRLRACAAKNGAPVGEEEDVVQKAAVKAWLRDDLPDDLEAVTHVMLALIKWESLSAITERARSREELYEDAADIRQDLGGADLEVIVVNRDLVRQAVPLLAAIYREVAERAIYEHQSVREIATTLGISREDVSKRLSRACVNLRKIIDGLERDDLAACAAAPALLALLALFDSRSFLQNVEPRPDTWAPAVPAGEGRSAAPVRGPVPHPRPRPPSGRGAGTTSIAALGLMAAAAAFMLLGDVPLTPAAFGPAEVASASIVAEVCGAELPEVASSPGSSSPRDAAPAPSSAPESPARSAGPKSDRFLKNDMHPAAYRAATPPSAGRGHNR
jgi:DNA-directed RNA polymerase specialized sigma24 family protein